MPKPENVNPNNFTVKTVLFDNGDFSIALGDWVTSKNVLAMRWNGDDALDKGYPKAFGNPMWFVIHDDLKQIIITGLMSLDNKLIEKIFKAV